MASNKFCGGVQKALVVLWLVIGLVGMTMSNFIDSDTALTLLVSSTALCGVALAYKKLVDIEARLSRLDCGTEKQIDDDSGVQIS